MTDDNLNVDSPNNVFCKYAARGPVCVVIDECMNILGASPPISRFFHAMPSKLFGRYQKCTGFSVIVVLHNMNPRHDRGMKKSADAVEVAP